MPKPKKPSSLSETQELRVLLEEVRSEQKLILERVDGLPERLDRVEFRLGRVEEELKLVKQAVSETTDQFRLHQKEHAA